MKVALVPRIAVPTGTAAATVVMRETTGDPTTDARRFIALAALDDEMLRGTFEELIVGGIYTVLVGRVLVLRVNHAGVRSIAAVVAIGGPSPTDVATNGATNVATNGASNSTPHPRAPGWSCTQLSMAPMLPSRRPLPCARCSTAKPSSGPSSTP